MARQLAMSRIFLPLFANTVRGSSVARSPGHRARMEALSLFGRRIRRDGGAAHSQNLNI